MPEGSETTFTQAQVEVLTKLAAIETKLDLYNETRTKADEAHRMSLQSCKDIEEMKDSNKWAFRLSVGLILGFVLNFGVNVMQGV